MSKNKRAWRRRVGRVSVYQRGNQYWIYYRQGKQVRRPTGDNRAEALTLAAKINAQIAEGAPTVLAFQPVELKDLIEKWLDHHEQVRRSSLATVRRYRTAVGHLGTYATSVHGSLRADRFTQALAEEFVRYLRTTKVPPNGHPNTQKRLMRSKGIVFILGTCRALFNFAREQRHLPAYAPNPFSRLAIERMPIDDAKPIRPMTSEQEVAFFKACDEWQFRVFFVLAFTGLRVGELTHLLIDNDLQLNNDVIRIANKPGLYWQVKTRNLRDVPLLPQVAQVLRTCIGSRTSGPVVLRRRFVSSRSCPLLEKNSMAELEQDVQDRIERQQLLKDAPLTRLETARIARSVWRDAGAVKETDIRTEFIRVTTRIGLGHLTCPKDLRHLFATSLQAAGVDPMIRRDIMGHTTLEMTSHYTHTRGITRLRELSRLADVRGEPLRLFGVRNGAQGRDAG
ncbi:MAG: tyrosine-type recombinase/integrase [Planctomycetota bacterium]